MTSYEAELVVERRDLAADGVLALTLRHPLGEELPAWEPGAHIDVVLGPDLERQYSLCGDPADRHSWRVAVLREPDGRGGSAHVHGQLEAGDKVRVRGPRNHFALQPVAALPLRRGRHRHHPDPADAGRGRGGGRGMDPAVRRAYA
jgi:ferredoxin-NADP reductase